MVFLFNQNYTRLLHWPGLVPYYIEQKLEYITVVSTTPKLIYDDQLQADIEVPDWTFDISYYTKDKRQAKG